MQVRLTDPGFAGFTGFMGTVKFVDGVSEHISAAEAERLGCIVAIEDLEGHNPSATQRMVDTHKHNLEELVSRGQGVSGASNHEVRKQKPAKTAEQPIDEVAIVVDDSPAGLDFSFTREDLEALADKEGISGLRNFAGSYSVKGRAIIEIIDELMALKVAAEAKQG